MNTMDKDPEARKLRIFDMAWPDVKEILGQTDVVVVPVGSTEQHGPHLPCGIDSYAGYYVAMEAAKKAQVPVAPLMPYGYSPFHMRPNEPGTLTLSASTFFHVMYDIGRSLIYHGFKKIVFVTGHTSNMPTLDYVIRALRYETGALAVAYAGDTEMFADRCQDLIDGPDELPGWHCGEVETSGAMLFCPELVRTERMAKGLPFSPDWLPEGCEKDSGSGFNMKYKGYPIHVAFDQWEYSEAGVMGNPFLASAEKGEKIYTRMIDLFAEFLTKLKDTEVTITKRDFPERW